MKKIVILALLVSIIFCQKEIYSELLNKNKRHKLYPFYYKKEIIFKENDIILNARKIILQQKRIKPIKTFGKLKVKKVCHNNSEDEYYQKFKTKDIFFKNCEILLDEKLEHILNNFKEDGLKLNNSYQYISLLVLSYNFIFNSLDKKRDFESFRETNFYEYLRFQKYNLSDIIEEWFDLIYNEYYYSKRQKEVLQNNLELVYLFFYHNEKKEKEVIEAKINEELKGLNYLK